MRLDLNVRLPPLLLPRLQCSSTTLPLYAVLYYYLTPTCSALLLLTPPHPCDVVM